MPKTARLPVVPYVWVEAEDYARLRQGFPGQYPEDHSQFAAKLNAQLDGLRRQGITPRAVRVDPDAMLRWIKAAGIQPDSQARARYVAWRWQMETETKGQA